MRGIVTAAALAALLAAGPAAAVYKCQVNGETVFSQTPCAADAEKVEIKVHRPKEDEAQRAEEHANWLREENAAMRADRKGREATIEIGKLEQQIEIYQDQMDKELAALREQKSSANNNLAGATLEQSIATEMQAVVEKYNTKIKLNRDKIASLRGVAK